MLRRLYHEQPDAFSFTRDNLSWVKKQIAKYPKGRAQSAVIPVLWRAQEQEGWLSRPAIEAVADLLGMPYIRALEVATFYFMFQLQPVGSVAHIQICGTTSCMICGAEDLIALCKEKIAANPHEISEDGKFSWEEVECLGACTNAPMAQIGKDYFEDLTVESLGKIIDDMGDGKSPVPGPQNGRYAAEPLGGPNVLKGEYNEPYSGSRALAIAKGDGISKITGNETKDFHAVEGADAVALAVVKPSAKSKVTKKAAAPSSASRAAKNTAKKAINEKPVRAEKSGKAATSKAKTEKANSSNVKASATTTTSANAAKAPGKKPRVLKNARRGNADDLKLIKGVGPKLEALLNRLGFYHFDQIANWSEEEVDWVDHHLEGFRGRIKRDQWIQQASILQTGELTEFAKSKQKSKRN